MGSVKEGTPKHSKEDAVEIHAIVVTAVTDTFAYAITARVRTRARARSRGMDQSRGGSRASLDHGWS